MGLRDFSPVLLLCVLVAAVTACDPDRFYGRDSTNTTVEGGRFSVPIAISYAGEYEFRTSITPFSEPQMASDNYTILQPSIDENVATSLAVIQEAP